MSVVRLEYNAATCRGKIAVRFGGNDVEAAKKLAFATIEELATRRNIAVVVGKRPPKGARYVVGDCKIKGGLLEIEFTTL